MAVRVQSNPFSIFMRKIGFSVGLEHTLQRVKDFAQLYSTVSILRTSDIKRLLHENPPNGWGLESSNEHILDVFRSLSVVQVRRGEITVLELGESLGVLGRLLQGNWDEAACQLLTHELVLADGDVFLNALAGNFDPEEFRNRASAMIEYKRQVLEQVFVAANHRDAIYAAVNIEAQPSNPGSTGRGLNRALDPTRLRVNRHKLPLSASRLAPDISDAYLTKALPRRKAWAVSLGLCDESGKQLPKGENLLDSLGKVGFAGPNCITVWPLAHELVHPLFVNRFASNFPILKSWDFLTLVSMSLGGHRPSSATDNHDRELAELQTFLRTYGSMNAGKSVLRKEMPIRVAYRCAVGMGPSTGVVLDVPKIVEQEQKQDAPRIHARPSRAVESALSDRGTPWQLSSA